MSDEKPEIEKLRKDILDKVKQYYKLTGRPLKHKVISRYLSYHGTTQGALSITGLPTAKQYFEPLVPSSLEASNFHRVLIRH